MATTLAEPRSRPNFPFSHSRTNSAYSLATIPARPTNQLKRGNSIRASKDVIPLMLKPEKDDRSREAGHGHRRGQSVNMSADHTSARRARPVSMFFNRMFTPKEEGEFDDTTTSSSHYVTQSTPPLSYETPFCSCPSSLDQAKAESRLAAKILNLETINETKDLTIHMLNAQLLDKDQEIELLLAKMAVLERALIGGDTHTSETLFEAPLMRPVSMAREYTDSGISTSSLGDCRSITDLQDENEVLKEEVMRLNIVLEDSANLVAELGI